MTDGPTPPDTVSPARWRWLQDIGRHACVALAQAYALLGFLGQSVLALAGWVSHPKRIRWRPVLFNLRSAGLDALPIVGLLSLLLGVLGGMLTARTQLGVGFGEFLDRFAKAISVSSYLVGLGKAPVFAAIVVMVGCFQGFRTHGGADSVGQQTTRAVVQSIFLVIVADALFSVVFNLLDL